ncbi:hypothetical protein [Actinoplanes sp. NBRC 101535]|uniref:hypothetical protein n=1 Tax=Actinoplanes sp. NBRC 101535 TaxID=3032196 RepID=UPI0024A45B5C|nr:hypothetical protein [Actinoplanes sp. NBRC 101535]GLY08278.1 hypothetical protein Acsp01_86570 [Actinoplanes sp. NBRC 101535]
MADTVRHPFGAGIADYVFEADTGGVVSVGSGAVIQFFSARTGGTQYTDLAEDVDGTTPITSVVSQDGSNGAYAAGDIAQFYGPEGVSMMWASADGGPRKLMFANDIAGRVGDAVLHALATAKGDLLAASGSGALQRLGVGTNGQVLTADSSQGAGMRWATPSGGGGGGTASPTGVLWVAAVNAPTGFAGANYFCDGVADDVQINTALNNVLGLPVMLSPGDYYIAAPVQLLGVNDVDTETTKILRGSGTYNTVLHVTSGILAGIQLGDAVCPVVSDLTLSIAGATHGIYATKPVAVGAGERSFWHGTIERVAIKGPFVSGSHTGWAMSLGSGFRFTVTNIEVAGVLNGIRVLNESATFNCGDAVFSRCFVEIIGNGGTAYNISSPAGSCNQMTFIACFGIAQPANTGTTMWKFDGGSSHIRVIDSNAEQFLTTVSLGSSSRDCVVDMVHVTLRNGAVLADLDGYFSQVMCGLAYVEPAATVTLVDDDNSYHPNVFGPCAIYADTGSTVNGDVVETLVLKDIVLDGPGTVAAALRAGRAALIGKTKLLTYAATVTIDCNAGSYQRLVLTGATTLAAPTNPADGQRLIVELIQDATGSRAVTWNAAFVFSTTHANTLTTTASRRDLFEFVYVASNAKWYVLNSSKNLT